MKIEKYAGILMYYWIQKKKTF